MAVPVTSSETVIGAMWIETTAAATNAKVYRAWGLMVALAVLVIGVSAVAAWFLARRLSRPVQALTQNIDRLGAGSFELDIEPSGVAELDEAQRALTATAERLDAVLSRERAFSAEASHQLRTPVASLRLAVEAELADPRPDATIALEEALIDIDRLDATVTSLLALARSSIAPRSDLDLGQVTDRAVSRWRSAFAAEGRPLRLHQPADAIRVVAREAAIDQAVDVLLDNALIHGEDEASVTLAAVAGGVTLSIRTDGPPIDSPDEIWATPTSPERPRIGLPLARRLVEAEGGRLVLAQPAPHPTFEIVLPT